MLPVAAWTTADVSKSRSPSDRNGSAQLPAGGLAFAARSAPPSEEWPGGVGWSAGQEPRGRSLLDAQPQGSEKQSITRNLEWGEGGRGIVSIFFIYLTVLWGVVATCDGVGWLG